MKKLVPPQGYMLFYPTPDVSEEDTEGLRKYVKGLTPNKDFQERMTKATHKQLIEFLKRNDFKFEEQK